MIAIDFPEKNKMYVGEDMFDLPVHDDGQYLTTCWALNKEDLERIAKTGKFYLRIMARAHPPIMLNTINPFAAPAPLTVPDNILNKVFLSLINDEELVIVEVPKTYYSFKVSRKQERESDEPVWMIYVRHKEFEKDQEFETEFFFYEELSVIGLVSEQYGEYDFIAKDLLKKDPETLLLLKRTNQTV